MNIWIHRTNYNPNNFNSERTLYPSLIILKYFSPYFQKRKPTMSAKERMKKYRERIKADHTKLKAHLHKEKIRDKGRREKLKNILHNDKAKKDEELLKIRGDFTDKQKSSDK